MSIDDDDHDSISSCEFDEKQDYKHFYNDPMQNNELLDEEEEDKVYNWNDVSDTLTVVSDVSEFYETDKENVDKPEKKSITIPLPFSFEERESRKSPGIHRRKMDDYIYKIKLEEEYHLNKRFKANPIPHSTKQPLYDAVKMRTEYQLKLQKKALQELTKRAVTPFYFAERDEKRLKELEEERKRKKEEYIEQFTQHFKANPGK